MEVALQDLLKLVKQILSFHQSFSTDIIIIKKFMEKVRERIGKIEEIVSSVTTEEEELHSDEEMKVEEKAPKKNKK